MSEAAEVMRFQRRAAPVIVEHRPLYKIGQVLLILFMASRGKRSKLARLHLFNWTLKRPDRAQVLIDAAQSRRLSIAAWGFDPALAIALRFAEAEGLIRPSTTGYELSDTGLLLAEDLLKNEALFASEKIFLRAVGLKITESMVDDASKEWA